MTQLSLDGGHEHAHLRLARALDPLPRWKPSGGGRGPAAYPDHRSHARDLANQLAGIRDRHRARPPVLGVNPNLVMVIEFNQKVVHLVAAVEHAGLRVLDASGQRALAAFSSDPELTGFEDRRRRYETEVTEKGIPRFNALFDAIDVVRSLQADDVLDDDVAQRRATAMPDELLRVDIECWCTEEKADTERRHDETLAALDAAGATVLDRTCRYAAGLSLIRADVPAGRLLDVVSTERISRVALLPRPLLSHPEVVRWQLDDLPRVLPPEDHAAVVAVIDSGVQAGNPLLAPAVLEALSAVPKILDGSDEAGHGSLVASLALFGSLEGRLDRRATVRAAGKLLGIRVLDADGNFLDDRLWQRDVQDALELAAAHGARVVNLSIGDTAHPYRPSAPTAIAGVLDAFARERDVVVVVSAGNVHWEEPPGPDYAEWLLKAEETGLAPPAMSALALTVGALVADSEQGARPARESVAVRAVGRPGTPSVVSRSGPGIENAIKPELCAPGGTYVYDSDERCIRPHQAAGKVVGAAGGRPDALLATDTGTSFAAPLVTHAALRVLGRYPQLTARAVRALVLASAQPVALIVEQETENEAVKAQRYLSGFGRVDAERAEQSTDHRVVLLAEERLLPDQVHFYTVPVPNAFFRSGRKNLAVALAFDPETRATRLTYLASRMSVFVYRGVSVDDVRTKFAASLGEPPATLDNRKVELSPSDTDRLLGANQAACKRWTNGWKQDEHAELVIVVRNTNRWAAADEPQPYALAVVLEAAEDMLTLYAELGQHFEALVEVEPEIEIR